MTREKLHKTIDQILDEMGFEKEVEVPYGSIKFEVKFEAGKEVLTVIERETKK